MKEMHPSYSQSLVQMLHGDRALPQGSEQLDTPSFSML